MKAKNKAIIYIKSIAIFCVICAHCNSVGDTNSIFSVLTSRILNVIGTWGVGCFFILSGALYSPKKNITEIIKGKAISIGIPWIISATAVYLYVALRKSTPNLLDWILYVIGYNTYCYYLAVLFVFFIIFYFDFMRKKYVTGFLIAVWFISVSFFYHRHILTSYLDIFNWIGYFSFGVLLKQNMDLFERIIKKIIKYRFILYCITICLLLMSVLNDTYGYFGIKNIFTVLFGCLTVMIAGTRLSFVYDSGVIASIGNNTLFIYLWHMPIAGIVAKLMSNGIVIYFVIMRPFIVLGIMCVAYYVLNRIFNKISCKWLYICFGLPIRR